MKIVENLFPELCNIYAESYNPEYLARCSDEIDLRRTNHKDVPAFVTEDVAMVYLGCSPERKQEQIIELLRPYRSRIEELIEKGTVFLVTGNAVEIFGREIRDGKFTGRIMAPIIMTGYVPDLLGGISMLSTDREVFGNGGCGKGYKEWVKVADGGPYLKTKARLG